MTYIDDLMAAFDGAQIPGGCDECNAYQSIRANAYGYPGAHAVTTHQDNRCPFLARIGRTPRRGCPLVRPIRRLKGRSVIYSEHPATVARRNFALLSHVRRDDQAAVGATLKELSSPQAAGAALASMVQIVNRALGERPHDPDAWIETCLLQLAAAEGDPPPGT